MNRAVAWPNHSVAYNDAQEFSDCYIWNIAHYFITVATYLHAKVYKEILGRINLWYRA